MTGVESDVAAGAPEPFDPRRWGDRTVVIGRVIVVLAVVATAVMLVLVERVGRTYEDALVVAEESAVLVADSVTPVSVLAGDLGEMALVVADGLDGARDVLATTQDTLDEIGLATATNVADMAAAAADVSDRLAQWFERIEAIIPGDTESIAEELRAFADAIEPVADQLELLGGQLQTGAAQLDRTDAALGELAVQMESIAAGIDELAPTFDQLAVTADELIERADTASERVELDKWLLRVLVLVVGAGLAAVGVVAERLARGLQRLAV